MATVAGLIGDKVPPGPTLYWDTVLSNELTTYRFAPFGRSTMPTGNVPALTLEGDSGVRFPPEATLNCDTELPFAFVVYTLLPSGLTAMS